MHGVQQTAFSSFLYGLEGAYWRNPENHVWLVDWKSYKLPYCSLYIVSPDGNWPCKVGISCNPYKRLLSLQTSVWKPLKVVHCYWLESVKEARRLEKEVHARLTADNVWLHGEWFDMRPRNAREMVEFVAAVEGIEINEKIDNPEVIEDIRLEISRSMTPDLVRSRIDVNNYKTFGGEDLARLAKSYKETGMVVDAAFQQALDEYEAHEAEMQLPSLRSAKAR